jgi:hypothetical protein
MVIITGVKRFIAQAPRYKIEHACLQIKMNIKRAINEEGRFYKTFLA